MSCFSSYPTIKRGSTVSWACELKNAAGQAIDLADSVITSQLRQQNGALVADLTVTLLDQTTNRGKFTLSADTSAWPVDSLQIDIRREVGGVVTYSTTGRIDVEAEVTANE
jgi:hypothetical protein